ncbi:MAG: hypothetical protein ACR2PS_05180 [Pseudomonadales bacterium]
MNPFQLTIALKSPLLVGLHAPRLDGVMWHVLFSHLGCQQKAADALSDYFDMAGEQGREYCKASSMRFGLLNPAPGATIVESLLALETAKVGVMRPGRDLSPENFKPNGKRVNRYVNVNVRGRPYKNRMDDKRVYYASHLIFDGVGKGDEVADLFRFYIPAIGVNANSGSGTIGTVYCSPETTDRSLVDDAGLPTRPIPVDDFEALSNRKAYRTSDAILMPPFRKQPSVTCAVPERIRKTTIPQPGV